MASARLYFRLIAAIVGFAPGGVTRALAAEVEFVGVARSQAGDSVALRASPTAPAIWRRVGEPFGDYVVTRYDAAAETVTLTAGATQWSLALRQARVRRAGDSAMDWTADGVPQNLRRLTHAAYQHCWDAGVVTARAADFVGPDRALQRIESIAGEEYAPLVFELGAEGGMRITDGEGRALSLANGDAVVIVVAHGTTLAEVSRRLNVPEATLSALNPAWAEEVTPSATRAVRVR